MEIKRVGSLAVTENRRYIVYFLLAFCVFILLVVGNVFLLYQYFHEKKTIKQLQQELQEFSEKKERLIKEITRNKQHKQKVLTMLHHAFLATKQNQNSLFHEIIKIAKKTDTHILLLQKVTPQRRKRQHKNIIQIKMVASGKHANLYSFLIQLRKRLLYTLSSPDNMVLHDTFLFMIIDIPLITQSKFLQKEIDETPR